MDKEKIKAEVYRLPFGGIKINQKRIFEIWNLIQLLNWGMIQVELLYNM